MADLARAIARILRPKSYCGGCGRPWFSDKRQPCNRCGSNSRQFTFSASDGVKAVDRFN